MSGNANPPNTDESPGIILSNAQPGNQFCDLFFNPEISKEEEEECEDRQTPTKQDKSGTVLHQREEGGSVSRAMPYCWYFNQDQEYIFSSESSDKAKSMYFDSYHRSLKST